MKRSRLVMMLALVLTQFSAGPLDEKEEQVDALLKELEAFGRTHRRWNVPPDHGRFLQLMTELTEAKRVLEIGTSNGYSSLWIARGLRRTGGKLITIEIDDERAAEARENFKRAGFDDIITLHHADAFKAIPSIDGPFDLIFLDARKEDYRKFFEITFDKLRPGGVYLGHNAIALADPMRDFLQAVRNHPQLITNVVQMGHDGFSVSYKRRPAGEAKASAK